MKLGKKQLILTGLVLTLGAAVYLNWQFSGNTDLLSGADAVSVSKELGEAEFVNTSTDKKAGNSTDSEKSTEKPTQQTTKKENTTNTTVKNSDEYFSKAKVERQQTQDEISEKTQEILNSSEQSEAVKAEAVAKAAELATIMEQQTNVESLIKAKGFEDCLAFIQNGECSIVVADSDFTADDALIIKDVATGQTGISADKIKITAV